MKNTQAKGSQQPPRTTPVSPEGGAVTEANAKPQGEEPDHIALERLLQLSPGGHPPKDAEEPPSHESHETPMGEEAVPTKALPKFLEFWNQLMRFGAPLPDGNVTGGSSGRNVFSIISTEEIGSAPRNSSAGDGLFITLQNAETRLYDLVSNVVAPRPLTVALDEISTSRSFSLSSDISLLPSRATITVPPAELLVSLNAEPVAANDTLSGNEDERFNLSQLLLNDTDGDQDSLSLVSVTASMGSVTRVGGMWLLNTPANWHGVVQIRYTLEDGRGGSAGATAEVTIRPVNDAPTAGNDTATATEDGGAVTISTATLLANDRDIDIGDSVQVLDVWATSTAGASVQLGGNQIIYNPLGYFQHLGVGATATDTFQYRIRDTHGGVATATVTVTVSGVNDGPIAAGNGMTVAEDVTSANLVSTLLANDTDVDVGDVLRIVSVNTAGTLGTVLFNAGAHTVQYQANAIAFQSLGVGATATDSFQYTISDGQGGTSTATVTVTVTGVNDGPVAAADTGLAAVEDATSANLVSTLLANDTDVDVGDVLRIVSLNTAGTLGAVVLNAGTQTLHYQANTVAFQALGVGATAVDTFQYTVSDGHGGTATATATVTVTGVNDGPVALGNAITVAEDGASANITASLLANDSDVDVGDVLTIASVNTTGTLGTVLFNAGAQTLQYQANALAFQSLKAGATTTDTFQYTVSDGHGGTASATVTVTVTGTNDAPTVSGSVSNQTTAEDSPFTLSVPAGVFSDVDVGDTKTLSASLGDGSALPGWLVFNAATGTFSGTPLNEHVGTVTVRVTATDGSGASVSTTFDLTVTNTNDAPTVTGSISNQSTAEDSPFSLSVPANVFGDVDVGDSLSLSATLPDGSALPGWLTFNAATGTFSGTPLNDDVGVVTVRVTATDIAGASTSTTFTLTVTNTNDIPVANADSATVAEDGTSANLTASLLGNDVDVDVGDSLTIASVNTAGTLGAVLFNAGTQTLQYQANAVAFQSLGVGATATDTFQYTVSDGHGGTATATVTVTVTGVNDDPVLTGVANSLNVLENAVNTTPALIDTDVSFSDVDISSFNGGVLKVQYGSGGGAEDALGIRHQGTGAGQIGVSGATVSYGGVAIGTITSNGANGANLTVLFNSAATAAAIEALTENLTYRNASDDPASSRTLAISITDGNGGTTAVSTVTVSVTPEGDIYSFTSASDQLGGAVGNDTFIGAAGDFSAADTITGREDTDVLRFTSGTVTLDTGLLPNLKGVEIMQADDNAAHSLIVRDAYFSTPGYSGSTFQFSTTSTVGVTLDSSGVGAGRTVIFQTGSGADMIVGGAGDDRISSGAGADTIVAGAGTDSILAGANDDDVRFGVASLTAADTVDGGSGLDVLRTSGGVAVIDTGVLGTVNKPAF